MLASSTQTNLSRSRLAILKPYRNELKHYIAATYLLFILFSPRFPDAFDAIAKPKEGVYSEVENKLNQEFTSRLSRENRRENLPAR